MENTDFFIKQTKEKYTPITVNAIYHVFADSQYHIGHSKINKSYVLITSTNGSGVLHIENKEIEILPNHIFLFDASKVQFTYHSVENWNFWWVEFEAVDAQFIEEKLCFPLYHPLNEMEQALFYMILDSMKFAENKTASYIFASLLCLFQQENQCAIQHSNKIKQADMYIRKNISVVNPQKVATYLKVSPRTLFNIFMREMNISPADYIKDIKLNSAKYLLTTTDTSIKDIAEYFGYADQFTFSKSFKQHFKISPKSYRKN